MARPVRVVGSDRVSKLPCVKINSQKTLFWRYQTVGENCLATIEGTALHTPPAGLLYLQQSLTSSFSDVVVAIYYFYREYYQKQLGTYNGQ